MRVEEAAATKAKKLIEEQGEAFFILEYRFEIAYKNRKDGIDAWEASETTLDPYDIQGPYNTEAEAEAAFTPTIRKHRYNGTSLLVFDTARVIPAHREDIEDGQIQLNLAMDGGGWLGADEAEQAGKEW